MRAHHRKRACGPANTEKGCQGAEGGVNASARGQRPCQDTSNSVFRESGGKVLTFQLAEQEYGIEILQAREVVGLMHIDPVPRTPSWMKGVINLRGRIIPVIDLRGRFQMRPADSTSESCIVVVDIAGKMTGVIVDFLSGVVTLEEDDFEDTPELGNNISVDCITGIAKLDDRVVIVLNIGRILDNEELAFVPETSEAALAV